MVTLPFLEAMVPGSLLTGGLGAPSRPRVKPPTRLAYIFIPNGVNVAHWTPKAAGSVYQLPSILKPLQPVKDDVLVLTGLTQDKGRANGDGAGDHARATGAFLTGAQPVKTHGANIRLGVSADQVAAQTVGHKTRLPSLEIGCEGGNNAGQCDSGYSCAYTNNISWHGPTTPVPKELDPRRVFDRLFAGEIAKDVAKNQAQRRRRRKSVLDFVLEDTRRLKRQLGGKDGRKVDEYFAAIRDVEKRLAHVDAVDGELVAEPTGLPEKTGESLEYGDHLRLMCDMLVLAFRGDVTRISTFMFARAGSNRHYRQIGVADGHHDLSHHGDDAARLAKIAKINRYHAQHFAYLLQQLKAIPEGESTLLDHCMILYGSGMSDGNAHNNENLPILVAGRGGGTIDSGRHVVYERETPMCNLLLSMLDRTNVHLDFFGDSTGRLPGLQV